MPAHVKYDPQALHAFCERWKVCELSLFGSVLREDFGPDSDVDVMVAFAPDAPVNLWDWSVLAEELQAIFGRRVDLVEKSWIKNPWRLYHIQRSHEVLYAA